MSKLNIFLKNKKVRFVKIIQKLIDAFNPHQLFVELLDKRGSSRSILQLVLSKDSSTVGDWSQFCNFGFLSIFTSRRSWALPHSTTYRPIITPKAPTTLKSKMILIRYIYKCRRTINWESFTFVHRNTTILD